MNNMIFVESKSNQLGQKNSRNDINPRSRKKNVYLDREDEEMKLGKVTITPSR